MGCWFFSAFSIFTCVWRVWTAFAFRLLFSSEKALVFIPLLHADPCFDAVPHVPTATVLHLWLDPDHRSLNWRLWILQILEMLISDSHPLAWIREIDGSNVGCKNKAPVCGETLNQSEVGGHLGVIDDEAFFPHFPFQVEWKESCSFPHFLFLAFFSSFRCLRHEKPDTVPDGERARCAFTCTPLLSCSLQVAAVTALCQGRGEKSALAPGVFN